ncbi:MAG: DUF3667 domain-containing protein [Sphingomonadaceae bacterium]
MATGFEAIGDAATGAVIARAVEPGHGEGHGTAANCLNCGTALIGAHCHACGQKAHVHRTLHEYAHDLLHSVFHFEGKVWRTLPMLAFKPGALTRRYIHGERAKFVSPLALFLFAVFLMFAVVGGLAGEVNSPDLPSDLKGPTAPDAAKVSAHLNAEQAKLNVAIAAARKTGSDTTDLQKQADELAEFREGLEIARTIQSSTPKIDGVNLKTDVPQLAKLRDKVIANPNLFLYKIQSSAYKYSWALIPLSVPFVWLLFAWRRAFKLYDHAVFVTYSLTFMLFLVVTLTALSYAGVPDSITVPAALIIPPLHMHKQLRGAYRVGRIGGLLRTAALVLFAAVVLSAFLVLLLALGLLG